MAGSGPKQEARKETKARSSAPGVFSGLGMSALELSREPEALARVSLASASGSPVQLFVHFSIKNCQHSLRFFAVPQTNEQFDVFDIHASGQRNQRAGQGPHRASLTAVLLLDLGVERFAHLWRARLRRMPREEEICVHPSAH